MTKLRVKVKFADFADLKKGKEKKSSIKGLLFIFKIFIILAVLTILSFAVVKFINYREKVEDSLAINQPILENNYKHVVQKVYQDLKTIENKDSSQVLEEIQTQKDYIIEIKQNFNDQKFALDKGFDKDTKEFRNNTEYFLASTEEFLTHSDVYLSFNWCAYSSINEQEQNLQYIETNSSEILKLLKEGSDKAAKKIRESAKKANQNIILIEQMSLCFETVAQDYEIGDYQTNLDEIDNFYQSFSKSLQFLAEGLEKTSLTKVDESIKLLPKIENYKTHFTDFEDIFENTQQSIKVEIKNEKEDIDEIFDQANSLYKYLRFRYFLD